jgi:hypothetical protein
MTAPDDTLWCVNVLGPDDVHACRDRADAFRFALWLNLSFLDLYGRADASPYDPTVQAVIAVWPHSRESHAEGLARRDREEPRWAAGWEDAMCGLAEEVLPQPGVTVDAEAAEG